MFICQHQSCPHDCRMQFGGTGSSARDIGAELDDEVLDERDEYEALTGWKADAAKLLEMLDRTKTAVRTTALDKVGTSCTPSFGGHSQSSLERRINHNVPDHAGFRKVSEPDAETPAADLAIAKSAAKSAIWPQYYQRRQRPQR